MSLFMIAACSTFAVALAGGQILFKLAALEISTSREPNVIMAVLSPWLMAALALYMVATALWVWILMHVPLSRAYPFVMIAMALVPLAAYAIFAEALTPRYLAGLAIMLVG